MSRPISPALDAAQRAYIAITGERISQTELQRLSCAIDAGMTTDEAATSVHEFFARVIDWDLERRLLAETIAARDRAKPL